MTDKDDNKPNNVIKFPQKPRKPTEVYQVEFTTESPPPIYTHSDTQLELSQMMFTDVPITVYWNHAPTQKQELWKVWNLCYRLQKQCLFSPHQPEVLKYAADQLEQIINNINAHQGDPNGPTEN